MRDRAGVADEVGVGGEDAVDIGPDPDLARVERVAEDTGGVIRRAAPEDRLHPLRRRADEAADDRDRPRRRSSGRRERFGARAGRRQVGVRLAEAVVGDDHPLAADDLRGEALLAQGPGQDRHQAALAPARDPVAAARAQLAEQRDPGQAAAQLGQPRRDLAVDLLAIRGLIERVFDRLEMALAQLP